MSAEVENSKDEDTKEQPKQRLKDKVKKHWQIGIKILELLLCVLCIGSAYDALDTMGIGSSDLHHVGVLYTSFTGYIVINLTFLMSTYLTVQIPFKTTAIFAICGACLFLTTGVLLLVDKSSYIRHYQSPPNTVQQSMLVSTVIFSFVNSAVFTLDAVLTFRIQEDF